MKRLLMCLVLTGAVTLSSVVTAAQATATNAAPQQKSEGFNIFKAFRKGGRGIGNIVLSPFEIPNQMVKEAKRHETMGGAVAGYAAGVPIGCGWMLYRLGVGVWDVLTGPFPTPTYEKSYIEPESLFPQDPYSID